MIITVSHPRLHLRAAADDSADTALAVCMYVS
jgi:hypothetical protein